MYKVRMARYTANKRMQGLLRSVAHKVGTAHNRAVSVLIYEVGMARYTANKRIKGLLRSVAHKIRIAQSRAVSVYRH